MIWSLGFFEPDMYLLNADAMSLDGSSRATSWDPWEDTNGEKALKHLMERHLADQGFGCRYVDVRSPSHRASTANLSFADQVWGWHRDDGGDPGVMFSWSNRVGTEIRDPFNDVLAQGRPFEIMAWENSRIEHRTPPGRDPERWFVRGRVNGPLGPRLYEPRH